MARKLNSVEETPFPKKRNVASEVTEPSSVGNEGVDSGLRKIIVPRGALH